MIPIRLVLSVPIHFTFGNADSDTIYKENVPLCIYTQRNPEGAQVLTLLELEAGNALKLNQVQAMGYWATDLYTVQKGDQGPLCIEKHNDGSSGKGGMSVCLSSESSLFTGPPDPQREEFHMYDVGQLAETILDSIQKILQEGFTLESGDPDALDIFLLSGAMSGLITPQTGMHSPPP